MDALAAEDLSKHLLQVVQAAQRGEPAVVTRGGVTVPITVPLSGIATLAQRR